MINSAPALLFQHNDTDFIQAVEQSSSNEKVSLDAVCSEYNTCKLSSGNLFVARTLFNRLDKVSVVSAEMWATLMHLLAKSNLFDSIRHRRMTSSRCVGTAKLVLNLSYMTPTGVIFTANCIKGNLFVARTLFNRLDKVSVVSAEMWEDDLQQMCWNSKAGAEFIIYDADRVDMAFLCKQIH
jgi:hypothetical protein